MSNFCTGCGGRSNQCFEDLYGRFDECVGKVEAGGVEAGALFTTPDEKDTALVVLEVVSEIFTTAEGFRQMADRDADLPAGGGHFLDAFVGIHGFREYVALLAAVVQAVACGLLPGVPLDVLLKALEFCFVLGPQGQAQQPRTGGGAEGLLAEDYLHDGAEDGALEV